MRRRQAALVSGHKLRVEHSQTFGDCASSSAGTKMMIRPEFVSDVFSWMMETSSRWSLRMKMVTVIQTQLQTEDSSVWAAVGRCT